MRGKRRYRLIVRYRSITKLYDRRHKKCTKYKVGDLMLVKVLHHKVGINKKLTPKFKGPYRIKAVLNKKRYVVEDVPGYNVSQKPFNTILSNDKLKPWIRVGDETNISCDDKRLNISNETELAGE